MSDKLEDCLIKGGILEGGLDQPDHQVLSALRERTKNKINTCLTREEWLAIMKAADPIKAIFEAGIRHFTTKVEVTGLEHIPPHGPVVTTYYRRVRQKERAMRLADMRIFLFQNLTS